MPHTRSINTDQDRTNAKYRGWSFIDDEDEADPFKDLIQRDPVVCDNCFLARYTRVTKEWWRGSFGWMDYERWVPYPGKSDEMPAEKATEGTRLTCGNCGHRNSKSRPVSKDHIQDHAENISETLDIKQIEHDYETLLSMVVQLNTSANQGRQDTHVFAPAVESAIRAVQQPDEG